MCLLGNKLRTYLQIRTTKAERFAVETHHFKIQHALLLLFVVSHIQRIGCQPEKTTLHGGRSTPVAQSAPRNFLTRWDVSSIPANGIFLTKN